MILSPFLYKRLYFQDLSAKLSKTTYSFLLKMQLTGIIHAVAWLRVF